MTKKKKKSTLGYVPLKFQPLETWTHEMCVLGRCDEDKTPDRERMECLLMAGLGKAKIVFPNKKATHKEFQEYREQKFPKLKKAGGVRDEPKECLRGRRRLATPLKNFVLQTRHISNI